MKERPANQSLSFIGLIDRIEAVSTLGGLPSPCRSRSAARTIDPATTSPAKAKPYHHLKTHSQRPPGVDITSLTYTNSGMKCHRTLHNALTGRKSCIQKVSIEFQVHGRV